MPLYLIRQDLTRMDCDAIVNPSNPNLVPGGGLDAAIHRAAGPQLADACRSLGGCPVGEARVTEAFSLPCRWVIHTAGPVWHGGWFGEQKKLERCYQSCFTCARELGCASLAIPLIGAGSNGVPETRVLPVAMQTLEACLLETDMTVYLVVFGKEAYALSQRLRDDVESYIDDHYVQQAHPLYTERNVPERFDASRHMPLPGAASGRRLSPRRKADEDSVSEESVCLEAAMPMAQAAFGAADGDLRLTLELDEPFSVKLLRLIDQKGMDDVACYKKANVSRQTWYKILNEKGYKPNKKTVLSFAVALELTLDETQTLLESVGFVLSGSSLFDVILMYCLSHGIYSVTEIDAILFQYDQETLYSKA